MESPGAPSKQKRRPRKHKTKQQELIAQTPPTAVIKQTQVTENKENSQLVSEPVLSRNPSKRRRKRNKVKKPGSDFETIQTIALDEVFPGTKLYPLENQAVPKTVRIVPVERPVRVSEQVLPVITKRSTIIDIASEHIFPSEEKTKKATSNRSVADISAAEIFPYSTIYTFDNIQIPRKLKPIAANNSRKNEYCQRVNPIQGIVDTPLEQLFPVDTQQKQTKIRTEPNMNQPKVEKSREEILAEREAKKAAKAAAKGKPKDKTKPATAAPVSTASSLQKSSTDSSISEQLSKLHISEETAPKETQSNNKAERKALFETQRASTGANQTAKPVTTKAERRALQEAQRAAKVAAQAKKAVPEAAKTKTEPVKVLKKESSPTEQAKKTVKSDSTQQPHMVRLLNHLYTAKFAASEIVNSTQLHPAITKLGVQYADGAIAGSKVRCLAFLKAVMQMISDYETPPEKEFSRGFEEALNPNIVHLQRCRPFSVSMTNALKYIKMHTRQLNAKDSDSDQKEYLLDAIQTYIRDQIEKAEEAISISVQEKIYDGDVILTYGCSSLIKHILEEANRRQKSFRVVIVDSRPRNREHEMLRQLVSQGIDCTCVLINAISYVMPEVTKVLLSAHALLANGCVMSRVGTAQIALVAKAFNVPVLVCCETHKFSERVQTDAFVYNEIGNPNDLILNSGTRENQLHNPLAEWESISSLTPLNLHYDVTPPELVTAVVTEVAILPCTSVPVILRIKPSEVGY
ncbi:translation initiation factor eIF-2B subunit delta [Wyeomyia smithii]|uniref:translation initiation factor eIF-2B subunit delta n=1 Tax=Wyeomyia smithii TaxID=174621 RepID=UPI002467B173|nr:translation initiation factor eIF-2B subunit delta [Wyeomyia smithii]XP_055528793.1 translation initiation factor eIF-2B subunit delta [Wyeomyia smithii]XP_055528794.1 translation initiation factor eIF-2B subunit delta [Wyeomyia smithii]XP_055528795.1 translation initiation factor eIF-2B subunit delta [Wyeomyia smithii]